MPHFNRDSSLRQISISKVVEIVQEGGGTGLNLEIEEYGEDFDYRNKLRDADWARKLSGASSIVL